MSFLSWFQTYGSIDSSIINIAIFEDEQGGRGAIALTDIQKDSTLFTIPRSLTLSTRTSPLPRILGEAKWRNYELDKGWVGLILCMMWEEAKGEESKWNGYMATLPDTFDTPMFWSVEEIEELRGTAIFDKIGREDAERDYYKKLLPAIQSRQDLFSPNLIPIYYSLERYHVHGSRILSRSFRVERWEGEEGGEGEEEANTSIGSGMDVSVGNTSGDIKMMDVDEPNHPPPPESEDNEGDSDDEDEDDPSDVAMVPMADMLNARYGCENAKLFYEEKELKMVSTKFIPAGTQIWNTYGDPPNSDLLRRYGHIDLFLSPEGGERTPADIVEVRADLIVGFVVEWEREIGKVTEKMKERIDWWLEEGGDDVFILDPTLPPNLISLIRLLVSPNGEWEKARDKSKLPKGKMDEEMDGVIVDVALGCMRKRLEEYPTNLEFDLALLQTEHLPPRKKKAVVVRVGEKRLLNGVIEVLMGMKEKRRGKRKVSGDGDGRSKKARR